MRPIIKASLFLFLIVLIINGKCLSQVPDSLSIILRNQPNDTAKISTLLQLIHDYAQRDPDLALEFCNELYNLSDSLKIQTGVIDALLEKSRIYIGKGKMDSAMIFCEKSIQMSNVLKEAGRVAKGYFILGIILYPQGPLPAREKFKQSLEKYRIVQDSSGMANALNAIGVTLFEQTKYDSAVILYLELIQLCEKKDYEDIRGKAYLNLGMVYYDLNDHEKAKICLRKSLEINEKLNNYMYISNAYNNLGNLYILEDDLDSAWVLYNKALEISAEINYPMGCGNAYNGLADIAERRGDYKKAFDFFTTARKYYLFINFQQGLLITYKNLGMIQERRGNYKQALIVYDSALLFARELGLLTREAEIYGNICDNYVEMGDYQSAYENFLLLNELKDSIMTVEKQEVIVDLEIKYEKEKDKAQILSQEKEIVEKDLDLKKRTYQRNIYLFSGSGIVLIFIFLFSYYSQRTRKNRIIAEQRIIQLEEEKKLLAARSIVEGQEEERKRIAKELHDGLGVLLSSAKMHFTTIRDKSPESKPMIEKAAKLLEQATGDVRRISHNMMPGLLTKYGLYEAVEDLFEQVDDMEELHANVYIEGEQARLKENTEIMLYRIIQEMVNNTLKHAEAKNIRLDIQIHADQLAFNYSDDGKGFDFDEKIDSKSIGLTSIQSRVKFLGGELGIKTGPGKGVRYNFEILSG